MLGVGTLAFGEAPIDLPTLVGNAAEVEVPNWPMVAPSF